MDIPESSIDELTGAPLKFEQVKAGMMTEVQQLEKYESSNCPCEVSVGKT